TRDPHGLAQPVHFPIGDSLTHTRNWTSTSVLVDLSEVKMQVRDKRIKQGAKGHLKRYFSAQAAGSGLPQGAPSPQRQDQTQSTLSVPPSMANSAREDGVIQPGDKWSLERIIDAMMNRQQVLVDEDNTDNEPVRISTEWTPVPISRLFDFVSNVWVTHYEQYTTPSFDEELALYDLLEADADGEDDRDIGIDPSSEGVLLS
ncbi:hypothetical protein CVT24_012568, partial [Panaeolus cyanescens]